MKGHVEECGAETGGLVIGKGLVIDSVGSYHSGDFNLEASWSK